MSRSRYGGLISIHTYPLYSERENVYRFRSDDFGISFLIQVGESLVPYVEVAINTLGDRPITPCVLGRRHTRRKPPYHNRLLVPPNVTEDSRLLSPDLVVPDVRVVEKTGKGYILSSPHLGSQTLYTTSYGIPPDPSPDMKFQAILREVYRDGIRHPKVRITRNSKEHSGVFKQNTEALEELQKLSGPFWWDIELHT